MSKRLILMDEESMNSVVRWQKLSILKLICDSVCNAFDFFETDQRAVTCIEHQVQVSAVTLGPYEIAG